MTTVADTTSEENEPVMADDLDVGAGSVGDTGAVPGASVCDNGGGGDMVGLSSSPPPACNSLSTRVFHGHPNRKGNVSCVSLSAVLIKTFK
jgi:hypothetical protein